MEDAAAMLTIGQLAQRTGLPVRTIRYWSDIGGALPGRWPGRPGEVRAPGRRGGGGRAGRGGASGRRRWGGSGPAGGGGRVGLGEGLTASETKRSNVSTFSLLDGLC
jgi:hypothetical protein